MKIETGKVRIDSTVDFLHRPALIGWDVIGKVWVTPRRESYLIEKDEIGAIFEDGKIKRLNQTEYQEARKKEIKR